MMAFKWWIDEPFIKGSRNPSDEDLRRLTVLAEESPGSLISRQVKREPKPVQNVQDVQSLRSVQDV
jgi:hypothetical protein